MDKYAYFQLEIGLQLNNPTVIWTYHFINLKGIQNAGNLAPSQHTMEFSIENQLLAILTMWLTEAMALFLCIRDSETSIFTQEKYHVQKYGFY